jgi:hypothetical protein
MKPVISRNTDDPSRHVIRDPMRGYAAQQSILDPRVAAMQRWQLNFAPHYSMKRVKKRSS